MRIISTILLFLITLCSYSQPVTNNYYFSNTGSDAAAGVSPATAWQTSTKFATIASSANPGDSILFKRGDTFTGFTTTSGNSGLHFGVYGTGAKPIMTGLTTITGWTETSTGSHIWDANCNSGTNLDLVLVGGTTTPPGRTPNAGSYFNVDSYTNVAGDTGTITSSSINVGAGDWTGAQIVLRVNEYNLDLNFVKTHTGNTITYLTPNNGKSIDGSGHKFFIQKHNSTLDQQNEWYYYPTYHVLRMYSIANPSSLGVQAATTDNFYNVLFRNNVTFNDIKFTGYDSCAVNTYYPTKFVINNCDFEDIGVDAVHYVNDSSCIVTNSTFNRIGNTGIYAHFSSHVYIRYNNIDSCGLIYGFGLSNNQQRDGILVEINTLANTGDSTYICDNVVKNVGYCGITFSGYHTQVLRNYVNGFGMMGADGGGIYNYGYYGLSAQRVVKNNIILNGYGNHDMYSSTGNYNMSGIYLDDNTGQVDVDSNVISNTNRAAIFLHNAVGINVRGNTIYQTADACGIALEDDDLGNAVRSIVATGNIINVPSARTAIQLRSDLNDYDQMGTFSGNYYSRSSAGNLFNTIGNVTAGYTLASWKSTFGFEDQTVFTQVSTDSVRFEYNVNATPSPTNLALTTYVDLKGRAYAGTVSLPPYKSYFLINKPMTRVTVPGKRKFVATSN